MGWIEFTLPAKGKVGKRRRAAAVKAIRSGDRDAIAALSRPAPLRLNVVGGFYDNADGSSRQAETCKLKAGDPVELRREPGNKFDPSAVAVFSERGVQIGYLGEQRTAWIGSKIDKGIAVRAAVDRLIGRRGEPLKPVLRIDIGA
jgi:hypothetical protein